MQPNKMSPRLVVGLLQGAMLAFLYYASVEKAWPSTHPSLFYPWTFLSLFLPFAISLSFGMRPKVQFAGGCFIAIILAGIGYYAVFRESDPSKLPFDAIGLLFSTAVALMIALSLGISGDRDRKWFADYPVYFDVAWKIVIQLCLVLIFVLGLWMILGLGGALFKIIGIDLFNEIIIKPWFAFPATTLAISFALYMTDVNLNIVSGIRNLFLTLLSSLLPLATGIVGLFLIGFLFVNLNQFGSIKAIAASCMQSAILIIILINAVYQDGRRTVSNFLSIFTKASCCLLLILVGLTAYGLTVRVQAYGWTAYRIQGAFLTAVLFWYALGYVAALWSNAWLKYVEKVNVIASYILLLFYFVLSMPIADPDRLAVASQMANLISGKVKYAEFDINNLKKQSTRFSQEALQQLQVYGYLMPSNSENRNEKVVWAESSLNKQKRRRDSFFVQTPKHPLPASFLEQDWEPIIKQIRGWHYGAEPPCLRDATPRCDTWVIQQNNQLVIMISSYMVMYGLVQDAAGVWTVAGGWVLPLASMEAISKNHFQIVPPPIVFPNLKIGQSQIPFNPR